MIRGRNGFLLCISFSHLKPYRILLPSTARLAIVADTAGTISSVGVAIVADPADTIRSGGLAIVADPAGTIRPNTSLAIVSDPAGTQIYTSMILDSWMCCWQTIYWAIEPDKSVQSWCRIWLMLLHIVLQDVKIYESVCCSNDSNHGHTCMRVGFWW